MPDDCPMNIGMLVDTSGSIVEYSPFHDSWIQMRQFLRDFVIQTKKMYKNGVMIALETFARRGNIKLGFDDCMNNTDIECMDNIIRKLEEPVSFLLFHLKPVTLQTQKRLQ